MVMIRFLTGFFILWAVVSCAQTQIRSQVELVESIPLETDMDNPDIRNTAEVWLEMVRGAKTSLDIEQFYFITKSGEPFDTVLQAIVQAGQRGVRVRILADAKMHKTYPETIKWLGEQKNIQTRIIDYNKLSGGVQHAKFFIVDGSSAFMGSQNFDWRAVTHIHELGLWIRHAAAVDFYRKIFELDWALAATNDKTRLSDLLKDTLYAVPFTITDPVYGAVWLTPTASPYGFLPDSNLWDEPHIIRMIDSAKSEVLLQFLIYGVQNRDKSAYRALDDALRRAAARGVTVRLIVSDWIKGRAAEKDVKALATVPNIEVKISEIPDWSGGYISFARVEHCKYIVADSSVFWLGSSNAEKSYFYAARNLGAVVINKKLGARLQKIFYKDWHGPYTYFIDPNKNYEPRKRGEE